LFSAVERWCFYTFAHPIFCAPTNTLLYIVTFIIELLQVALLGGAYPIRFHVRLPAVCMPLYQHHA
jgi:hypothetical protein